MNDEGDQVKSGGSASDHRPVSAVTKLRDEPAAGERDKPESIPTTALLERVLERTNLQRALKQVRSNQGATFASMG
jgi:RNA-directed DNA polymerase